MARRGSEYARHEDDCNRRSDEGHRRGREQHTAYEDDRYEDERRRNEARRRGGDDRYGHEDERRRSEDRRYGGDRRPDDRRDGQRSRLSDERDPECRDRQRVDDDGGRDPRCRYSGSFDERDPECRDRQRSEDDGERDPNCRYSRLVDERDPECRDGRRRDSQLERSPRRSLTPQRRSLTPTQSRHEAKGSRNSRPCNDRSRGGSDGTDESNAGGTWKPVKHADDLKHLDGGREGRESDDESEKTEFQSENGTWRPITPQIAQRIREAMADEENRQKQEEARQKAEASRRRSRDLSGSEDDAPKPRRSDASRASTMRDKTPPRGSFGYGADRSPAGSSAGRSPMKASKHSPRSKKFSVDFDMAVEADDVAGLIWKFESIGASIRRLPEKVSTAKGIKKGDLLVGINNRNVEGFDRSRIEDIWMQEQDSNDDFFRLTFVPP